VSALWTLIRRGFQSLWRNRWTFGVPVVTLVLPAVFYAVSLPDEYEAKALVQVRPLNSASIDYALPQEAPNSTGELMATVRDRIFTRPNLKVALPAIDPGLDPEDPEVLEEAAKAYAWEQMGMSIFELSRRDPDPKKAAEAVNVLLTAFLERERDDHLRQAERKMSFHQGEEKEARSAYDALLVRLDAFRREHADVLPERKDAIEAELRQLQTDITAHVARAVGHRQRTQLLEEQLVALVTQPVTGTGSRVSASEEMYRLQLAEEQRALNGAEEKLANARARYQERHPDVIRLREAVSVHQAAVRETTAALDREREVAATRASDGHDAQVARRRESLLAMKRSAEAQAERAEAEASRLQTRREELHHVLAKIPGTSAALDPLLREVEQADELLESRVDAARDARAVVALYRGGDLSDVTGFQVTAWAVPPVKPSGPGRWRYLATALVLGLAVGYGLLLLTRRHEGTTVRTSEDLDDLFPAAVVVHVPRLGGKRPPSWPSRVKDAAVAAYVLGIGGASVYLLAAFKGWVAAPGWLRHFLGVIS